MDIEQLKNRARLLLAQSATDEQVETSEAIAILRELANLDGEWSVRPMTLDTFRAGAKRVEWSKAAPEHPDARDYFSEADAPPAALWVYPGDVWIAELADGKFELCLDGDDWRDAREVLDVELHKWALVELDLCESDVEEKSDADVVDEIGGW